MGKGYPRGERILDDSFVLLFNAHDEPLLFFLPAALRDRTWAPIIDTGKARFIEVGPHYQGDKAVPVRDRSVVVLRRL